MMSDLFRVAKLGCIHTLQCPHDTVPVLIVVIQKECHSSLSPCQGLNPPATLYQDHDRSGGGGGGATKKNKQQFAYLSKCIFEPMHGPSCKNIRNTLTLQTKGGILLTLIAEL